MTEYIVSLEPSEYDETLAHRSYPVKMRKGGTWEQSSVSCTYCTDELTEVVRCRDCKHNEYGICSVLSHDLVGRYDCPHMSRDWYVSPDDYCAWGERRQS